jgi:hypothetical protein
MPKTFAFGLFLVPPLGRALGQPGHGKSHHLRKLCLKSWSSLPLSQQPGFQSVRWKHSLTGRLNPLSVQELATYVDKTRFTHKSSPPKARPIRLAPQTAPGADSPGSWLRPEAARWSASTRRKRPYSCKPSRAPQVAEKIEALKPDHIEQTLPLASTLSHATDPGLPWGRRLIRRDRCQTASL